MNEKIREYAMSMFVAVVAITAAYVTTTNDAAAYESSNIYQYNHYTVYYKGGPQVCGLHLCQPRENPNP